MKIYIVDAFTDEVFKGNPAAVCPVENWPTDEIMQKIAIENNLSETAFFKKEGERYKLRWFTPEYEIDLCGHATLATAYVIFSYIEKSKKEIIFDTISGKIKVTMNEEKSISMDMPVRIGEKIEVTSDMIEGLGVIPVSAFKSRDIMIVLQNEDDIRYLQPDFQVLNKIGVDGIIVTAKGNKADFVSRYFIPNSVINEDPVTGSAHCTMVPYWAGRLNKETLVGEQLSKRGGSLKCELQGDIVKITGNAVLYLEGVIRGF